MSRIFRAWYRKSKINLWLLLSCSVSVCPEGSCHATQLATTHCDFCSLPSSVLEVAPPDLNCHTQSPPTHTHTERRYFKLRNPCIICCNYSSLPKWHRSSHRRHTNSWAQLYSSNTLFTKQANGLDLDNGHSFSPQCKAF